MRHVQFTKMQGLGNDFIVIEGPLEFSGEEISALCDRRFGVGADGVLVVSRLDTIRMEYWNADGSKAEMCGNGLRCAARFAYDRGWPQGRNFQIQTPSGVRTVKVIDDLIEAEIGRVSVSGHAEIDGQRLHLIDVGNPHAVIMVDDVDEENVPEVGERVGTDAQFPEGCNVEFAQVTGGAVRMRVWERGVGETSACGTGMVAAAFVSTKTDRLEGTIEVAVPGGTGYVEFREGVAWLRGPAAYSFRGSVGEH